MLLITMLPKCLYKVKKGHIRRSNCATSSQRPILRFLNYSDRFIRSYMGKQNKNEEKQKSHLANDKKFSMQSTISDFIKWDFWSNLFQITIYTCIITQALSYFKTIVLKYYHKIGLSRFLSIVHSIMFYI